MKTISTKLVAETYGLNLDDFDEYIRKNNLSYERSANGYFIDEMYASQYAQAFCDEKKQKDQAIIREHEIVRQREEEKRNASVSSLKESGASGYYQYRVINITDDTDGTVNLSFIEHELNRLALEGWYIKCAYSNQIGRISNTAGTNSTVDQNILILERFVKI